MDCIIPSHSARLFCAAIGCLSRMGKDLYVEFDPLEGLTLRALNDAKSAFASFHFEPTFFERCSAPVSPTNARKRERDEEEDEDENRYSCRVPLRAMAAIVRPRRHVLSLRLRNEESSQQQHYLSFEFQLQKSGLLTIVHRMGVAEDAQRVVATASREGGSEIITSPAILLKMLEPLHKRSPEVALIINDVHKVVTATSFHHGEASNAILQTSAASQLKTETCIGADEFDEFDFRDDRTGQEEPPPPKHVNEEVALVFLGKESKAMLTFCAQAILNQELRVTLTFHWGGKPVIMETKGPSFSAQLIMATIDHKLLGGLKPVNTEAVAERERRASRGETQ